MFETKVLIFCEPVRLLCVFLLLTVVCLYLCGGLPEKAEWFISFVLILIGIGKFELLMLLNVYENER